MKNPFTFSQFSRLIRWGASALGIVLLLALISWLTLPSYLKSTLERQVEIQTGRQFNVDAVTFNPLTLTVNMSQIRFLEADKKSAAFSADNLEIKASVMSLFRVAPIIRAVVLTRPHLQLVRAMQDGKEVNNFSDVIVRLAQHPGKGDPMRFSVSNIQLNNGDIELNDHIANKQVHIESLKLNVPFLSNFVAALDVYVEPYLSATVNGSKVELKGRSKPFSATLDTDMALDIDQFNVPDLIAFSPKLLPFTVKSAKLSTRLMLNFSEKKNGQQISLSGTANLNDVALQDQNGAPLYASKQINLNLKDANLVNQHIAINLLEVIEPQIWASLDQHGKLNWSTLQNKTGEKNTDDEPTSGNQVLIELAHYQLKNGTVHWSDAANATPAMSMDISNIAVDARNISTKENAGPAKIMVSLGRERHQRLHFDGLIDPKNTSVSGQLALSDFSLSDYQPYANRFIDASVAGKLALQTQMELKQGNVRLSAFSGSVEDLKVQASRPESGSLSAKKIGLENLGLDGASRRVKAKQLVLDRVQGDLFRTADGTVNVFYLMKKSAASAAAKTQNSKPTPAWQTEIEQVTLNDSSFMFGDKAVQPAVVIKADDVNLKLEQVSSNLTAPVKLAMRATLNKTGKFAAQGVVSEKAAQLDVDVQNFAVTALQSYFTQFLNVSVTKGSISTKGKVAWQASGEIKYQGGLKLANLVSIDKESADDFLKWKLLEISGINLNLGGAQPNITLGKIDLNEFYARAILSEQGKLNLRRIVAHPESAATPAQKTTAPALLITVEAINLNNGTINYTDNFISPHYSMRMTGMKGSVGAIHSNLPQAAPISINGKLDNEAPVTISGSLNPLFSPMLLDIKLTATGVDLPRLTTYALKYAGYPIMKGKLSLDVEYHIKDNQLTASNALKIDQLTFGDKVDNPNATHLPVPFLMSLLTDANGQINLDLPISGTINDPDFSIGGLIVRVFINVIEKVVTSPFSLLAHAFGSSGSEEMAYIEFDPGSSKLTDTAKAKLDSLAQSLEQHPRLKLDIIGRADIAADTEGLRERMLARQIKKIKNRDEEAGDDATITEADRARAIEKIYSAAKFDKPRNILGIAKSLPTAEMEKLIMANINVTDDDIRALALRRESVVHAYLIDTEHVAADRLFTIAPKLSGDGIKDKGAISRVDFELKM